MPSPCHCLSRTRAMAWCLPLRANKARLSPACRRQHTYPLWRSTKVLGTSSIPPALLISIYACTYLRSQLAGRITIKSEKLLEDLNCGSVLGTQRLLPLFPLIALRDRYRRHQSMFPHIPLRLPIVWMPAATGSYSPLLVVKLDHESATRSQCVSTS